MEQIGKNARAASKFLQNLSLETRNEVLLKFIVKLKNSRKEIEEANMLDKKDAISNCLIESIIKRLDFESNKFNISIKGIEQIINMDDPLGKCDLASEIVSGGLFLYKVTCPIGVLAIFFEARPEAAIQIASLSIKAGNALIMKGGKEAKQTNKTIYIALQSALTEVDQRLKYAIQLVQEREEIKNLLQMHKYIDLVIPRGSNNFVEFIKSNTIIPVLGHSEGICHILVDEHLNNFDKAIQVIIDSKTDYPAACNAVEALLVHKNIADIFVPLLDKEICKYNVEFKTDEVCYPLITECKKECVSEEEFCTEYLNLILGIKVVEDIEKGIDYINTNGSHHTDCILTDCYKNAQRFVRLVDSAGVYVNCSTRFSDGFRYGFGAEVGISTNKIHARGPVGIEGLTIYKYRMYGIGHTLKDIKSGETKFMHKKLDTSYGKINEAFIDEKHKLNASLKHWSQIP